MKSTPLTRFALPPALTALLLGLGSCGVKVEVKPHYSSSTSPTPGSSVPSDAMTDSAMGVYALGATKLDGDSLDLSDYQGDVTLFVNVASECGYTRQYAGLQELHTEFRDEGFAVLGFPSNEFGGQEPGSAEEIRSFCDTNYKITFPMFEKVETKAGENQSPIYGLLGKETGELPAWNFGKYLVSKEGKPLAYFASAVEPNSPELREAIQAALKN